MTIGDLILTANRDTRIKIIIPLLGLRFETTHSGEYFFKMEDEYYGKLASKRVTDIAVRDGVLEVKTE